MEHNTAIESSTGFFLQQVYTTLAQELPMQTLNPSMITTTYVNPQNIDRMVEMEMKRIKENCSRKEQQYVEQMLLENPITVERRTIVNRRHQPLPQQKQQNDVSVVSSSNLATTDRQQQKEQQQQRSEACRRSRYNNKIKKAKSKYSHKYMSQKLVQSTQMFNCIQDLIAQAENHLLGQGLSKDKLHQLRHSYGVDTAQNNVRKLEHIMQTEEHY